MTSSARNIHPDDAPDWYKQAVIYQAHVRAFRDSDGDGIGDFRGLTERLDYLRDLGVTALWLLPFYPSPLRDDGYDIADYTAVHPDYGTLADVRRLIREAHKRGLRVITELVLNHTSDQHRWFQRARRARPGTSARNFYVWSDTDDKYTSARIIFKDFETSNWSWDPVAKAYYWHRFYHHQPDLNFENPAVHSALLKVVDFWFAMGVDGLRLDAVPYLYEREGTTCENLPETHAFLKKLRRHVDEKFPNRMLLAEANQWPEDAIAYFGDGDECHMAFHFPLMPRLFMGVRMEDRFPIIDILQQTPDIPDNCQWAVFLRNHDELTLEMVTDEERDYMYRVYAHDRRARINLGIRRRLAPLLSNNRRKTELLNGLLFSLPGTPVIYYGDEIGMGDNVYLGDRNGVRTPMQWSPDRNAGFSDANPQRLYLPVITDPEYHYETVNVEAQQNNPSSMLWWIRRLIALRQRCPVFGRGTLRFLHPENPKVLAFLRTLDGQDVLVVANLSRFVQCVELDLSEFKGHVPVEMFGQNRFPPIGDLPYFLTLGPHAFYWFNLQDTEAGAAADEAHEPPTVTVPGKWRDVFRSKPAAALEAALAKELPKRRWFGAKARKLDSVTISNVLFFPPSAGNDAAIILLHAAYADAEGETYQLPVTILAGERAETLERDIPHAVFARLRARGGDESALLCDAVHDTAFCEAILDSIRKGRRARADEGEVAARRTASFARALAHADGADLHPSVSRAEQSNSSIAYGRAFMLKFFRRVAEGVNADLEMCRFLTERAGFEHVPEIAGYIEFGRPRQEPRTLAVLQTWVPNQGDAWSYTLSVLGEYFERASTEPHTTPPLPETPLLELALPVGPDAAQDRPPAGSPPPDAPDAPEPPEGLPPAFLAASEFVGHYLHAAELLGRRTAEMHLALGAHPEDPAFAPEPFTQHHHRSVYQSMRNLSRQALRTLRRRARSLPEDLRERAHELAEREEDLLAQFSPILEGALGGMRIRTHGDYHLGQVLFTGRDFVIIDFEGEPARPLSERRMKRSPLRDVAGMLRSFDYAVSTALHDHRQRFGVPASADHEHLDAWAAAWRSWVGALYLRSYLTTINGSPLVPRDRARLDAMLRAFILEKAVYEMEYELNSRPDWVSIPLRSILQIIDGRDHPS